MAIELITGLPGNAKTLYTLSLVIERAARENRAVYYAGLLDFQKDDPRLKGTEWFEIDPKTWPDAVPSGAIVLIDEAQEVFRSRSLGTIPGEHVTLLEKHRHKGLDFYMMTQHPSLIDPAIRKLTQTHHHMIRVFGMEMSTVHLWRTGVRDNCDKPGGRKDSEKTKWAFRKDLYGLYKSADVHTMKRSIPARVWLVVAAPVVVFALGFGVYWALGRTAPASPSNPAGKPHMATEAVEAASGRSGRVERLQFDPLQDAAEYTAKRTPRIAGLPHTAPVYDPITEPTRAPVPAACIQVGAAVSGKVDCKCFTQQGTPMGVEFGMCMEFARNGYFQDFDPERDREQDQRMAQGQRVLENHPDVPQGPAVVAFAQVPELPRVPGRPMR